MTGPSFFRNDPPQRSGRDHRDHWRKIVAAAEKWIERYGARDEQCYAILSDSPFGLEIDCSRSFSDGSLPVHHTLTMDWLAVDHFSLAVGMEDAARAEKARLARLLIEEEQRFIRERNEARERAQQQDDFRTMREIMQRQGLRTISLIDGELGEF